MTGLAAQSVRDAYVHHCGECNVEPRAAVLAELDAAIANRVAVTRLEIRGNAKANANRRVTDVEAVAICDALAGDSSITALDLSFNPLTDASAEPLAKLLTETVALKELNLTGCDIGPSGGAVLAEALARNSSLETLKLNGNSLGQSGADFAEMLMHNQTIEHLDLGNTELTVDALVALATALHSNHNVRWLSVANPRLRGLMDDFVLLHFGQMMRENTGLAHLDLSKMAIRDAAIETFVGFLADNTSLVSLNLRCNKITMGGGAAIAKFLSGNPSVESVNLDYNRLDNEGALAVAQMLQINNRLHTLQLASNSIGDVGLAALAGSLQSNDGVRVLRLWGNLFERGSAGDFGALLKAKGGALDVDFSVYTVDGVPQVAKE